MRTSLWLNEPACYQSPDPFVEFLWLGEQRTGLRPARFFKDSSPCRTLKWTSYGSTSLPATNPLIPWANHSSSGNNCNGVSSVDKWFPQASELQKLHASTAHERAKQIVMDVRNLTLNLRQGGKDRTWRDDGLLPGCPAGLGCLLPPRKGRAHMAMTTAQAMPVHFPEEEGDVWP